MDTCWIHFECSTLFQYNHPVSEWGQSTKLGTLRSHDWVHSKSDQHFPQEQIKTIFMGTFSINPTFAHWAHWSHLLSVLPVYLACAWWVFWSLSPVYDPLPCPLAIPPLSTLLHRLIEFSAPPTKFEPCSPFPRRFPTGVASWMCIRSPFYSPASCPAPVNVYPL